MKIINKTKNSILAEECMFADTFLKRIKGLLGKKDFNKYQALILKPCNSVHTFFMRFSIDVLFIDKDNKIIKAISELKPFRITSIYFNAILAIELPSVTIQATSTQAGDTISFIS